MGDITMINYYILGFTLQYKTKDIAYHTKFIFRNSIWDVHAEEKIKVYKDIYSKLYTQFYEPTSSSYVFNISNSILMYLFFDYGGAFDREYYFEVM